MQLLRPVAVIVAGAVLALLLGAATLFAVFAGVGYPVVEWQPVEATRRVLVVVAVLVVHLLWIVTWCVWRRLGWSRFVAAVLLLPAAGLLAWAATALAWEVSTRGNGWAWGSELVTQEPSGGISVFVAAILVPAVVVAGAILIRIGCPPRPDDLLVRPAWGPRELVRGAAMTLAVLGGAALTVILVVLVLAVTGVV